jgi:hypothetical protein
MIIPEQTKMIRVEKDADGKPCAVFVGEDGNEINRVQTTQGEVHTELIMCDCGTEALLIQVFDKDLDDEAFLSVFNLAGMFPRPFWCRVRQAWKVIRTGLPYGDQLVFSVKKLEMLRSAAERAITIMRGWQKEKEQAVKSEGKPL